MAITTSVVGTSIGTGLVYTCSVTAPQTGTAITCIMICNTSSSTSATVTLYAVPSTGGGTSPGSASNTNMIMNALPIPAGETVSLDQEKLVLGNNDTLVAVSSQATTLTILISTLPV